jgi:predicted small lipoprotein YifL
VRRSLAIALVLPALALPFAGCGEKGMAPTPPACITSSGVWLTALADAPKDVALDQSTPISDCLPKDQTAAQQEEVGRTAVEVATQLSRFMKTGAGPGGQADYESSAEAAVMAGYLVGAVQKAAKETEGIHATLVQRIESAATNSLDGASQKLQGAYQRGHEAGLESG